MDSKGKSQRKVLAAKADLVPRGKTEKKVPSKKDGKAAEKDRMPELIAGREVLGRQLSVIKTTKKKDAVWVKGAVKDFDEPNIKHKIQYDLPLPEVVNEGEEWLCLSKNSFMWRDDDFICPFANPTYSSKHTPKGEDAIGQRVKVFWTAMSTWYQGKVTDYDKATGKHKVRFHDGEKTEYDLQHEALVWLDVPQLSSEAALKRMRSDEGEPIAVIRNDENQAPVERVIQLNGSEKASPPVTKPVLGKKKQATADKALAAPPAIKEGPKTRRLLTQAKSTPKAKETKAKVASASPRKKAAAVHVETNGHASPDVKKKAVDEGKATAKAMAAASEPQTEQKNLAKDSATQETPKISITATGNGKAAGKAASKSQASPKTQAKPNTEEASRKRSRLGDPALTSSGSASVLPEAKRRAVVKQASAKPASAPAKPGRKPKGEESRLGAKRQKKEADLKFEECCQAVLGARVGVWWEDDNCYYKGKIMAHDWYRKKLKICYDDGVEEYIQPQKEETRFTWLTPRASTAGATSAVHAAFQYLGASNAGLPYFGETDSVESSAQNASSPNGQSALPGNAFHTADGSHLDALVPMRVNGCLGGKGDAQKATVPGETASHSPYPVDSTTRAMSEGKAPSFVSAAISSAQQLNLPASTAGLFLGPQSMLGPSNGRSLSFAQPLSSQQPAAPEKQLPAKSGGQSAGVGSVGPRPASAVSRSGAAAETAVVSHSSPPPVQGPAAEGWKVTITFRGDHKQYHGRVLAYKADTRRHLVLWEDGEDEWIDISEEQLTWHTDRGKSSGFSTGLPPDEENPRGDKLKGWTLAVFWKHECKFFDGIVIDYDGDLDQHTIHYSDGEERCESVHNLIFKYVLPPNVQPVGARRIHAPRRWQDSGSEQEDGIGYRRQRRRLRATSVDDDTDEEWMGAKAAVERRTGKPPFTVPPIRHLSIGNQRQQSLMQQYASSPTVRTPGGSEIRRMSSKCGSLLFFEGEDNPAVSPATSPKTSPPQVSSPVRQDSDSGQCKLPSAIDRKVTGLKNALGFKVGVKRVRLYLKGWPPEGLKDRAAAAAGSEDVKLPKMPTQKASIKQEATEVQDLVPNSQLLKLMMERVEAAALSMQLGTPVNMSTAVSEAEDSVKQLLTGQAIQDSLPSKTILSTKSAAAGLSSVCEADRCSELSGKDNLEGRSQSVPPSSVTQPEQHMTPPPSPFANCYHGSDNGSEGGEARDTPQLDLPVSLADSGIYSILDKLRGVPQGEILGSPSHSPDTPSVMGEKQIMALSRNSSVMSDPLLAELLHCKLLSCKGQASLQEQLGIFQAK